MLLFYGWHDNIAYFNVGTFNHFSLGPILIQFADPDHPHFIPGCDIGQSLIAVDDIASFEDHQRIAGSVDLYFGPQAPAGKESNWIQTVPGRGWWVWFRIYGPTEPFFDKSWQLPDFEKIQ